MLNEGCSGRGAGGGTRTTVTLGTVCLAVYQIASFAWHGIAVLAALAKGAQEVVVIATAELAHGLRLLAIPTPTDVNTKAARTEQTRRCTGRRS